MAWIACCSDLPTPSALPIFEASVLPQCAATAETLACFLNMGVGAQELRLYLLVRQEISRHKIRFLLRDAHPKALGSENSKKKSAMDGQKIFQKREERNQKKPEG